MEYSQITIQNNMAMRPLTCSNQALIAKPAEK
jgi:hypothetical protein